MQKGLHQWAERRWRDDRPAGPHFDPAAPDVLYGTREAGHKGERAQGLAGEVGRAVAKERLGLAVHAHDATGHIGHDQRIG